MRTPTLLMRLLAVSMACSVVFACGEAPKQAATDTDAAQHLLQPSLRKPPSLASTIYDVDCANDADCTLVPQGDVCQCAGWGGMREDNAGKFLQRRARLGGRCPEGAAPACTPDTRLHEARCQNKQCVAGTPRALTCVDKVLAGAWPLQVTLTQTPGEAKDPALSVCPASAGAAKGAAQVFLLHPKEAGRYRIALSDAALGLDGQRRPHWLIVRTPDCLGEDVACRVCDDAAERCLVDEWLGPDDTAVIVVRNCDADCTLQVAPWDAATPLVPPL